VACDKIFKGKCEVNWEMVCRPKEEGGRGILNLKTFPRLLGLGGFGTNGKMSPNIGLYLETHAFFKIWFHCRCYINNYCGLKEGSVLGGGLA
jgi:hypothetical protein